MLSLGGKLAGSASLMTRFNEFEMHMEYRNEGKKPAQFELTRGTATTAWRFFDDAPADATLWGTLFMRVEFDSVKAEQVRVLNIKTPAGEVSEGTGTGSGAGYFGLAALRFEAPEDTRLLVRNIKLRPISVKSLFNGKDLTGWKVFPGKKSKFTVTSEGGSTSRTAPATCRPTANTSDFVLQLECITQRQAPQQRHLLPLPRHEYQNGYEAQIRNQFTAEPTQEYLVEEYDPKTHKLLGKKKVKSTAFDYGTGAIYRRVPARKEMAKDGEWFTHDRRRARQPPRHLGQRRAGPDWTDNRPRERQRPHRLQLEAGHISIQGHDPTTDLSFRNFRIAEFATGK